VQVRVTANAASTGGSQVTASIYPALVYVQGSNQNIASDITAGLLANVANSHKVGWVIGGDSFFLAMPRLPEEVPYPTANQVDEDTGVSIRMYYGSLFGQNQRGMIYDCLHGSTAVDEYGMRMAFPLQ
jgi:hypothetical protein